MKPIFCLCLLALLLVSPCFGQCPPGPPGGGGGLPILADPYAGILSISHLDCGLYWRFEVEVGYCSKDIENPWVQVSRLPELGGGITQVATNTSGTVTVICVCPSEEWDGISQLTFRPTIVDFPTWPPIATGGDFLYPEWAPPLP